MEKNIRISLFRTTEIDPKDLMENKHVKNSQESYGKGGAVSLMKGL